MPSASGRRRQFVGSGGASILSRPLPSIEEVMAPGSRIIISKTSRCRRENGGGRQSKEPEDGGACGAGLNLMMICCEERAPYGPAVDTATMFLELLCAAYERYQGADGAGEDARDADDCIICITVYHAQSMDYPTTQEEWDGFDGIIVPGSLSAAYDTHIEWIHRLQEVIQTEMHEKQRKTLGVCFGHQCFAHSFQLARNEQTSNESSGVHRRGGAAKCSIGSIAGRRSFPLTEEGRFLFGSNAAEKECVEMLFTRGDMVQSIPPEAISLCGSEDLPNEACAYYASEGEVSRFQSIVRENQQPLARLLRGNDVPLPYAMTFQAHPEYMTPTGCKINYPNTVEAMKKRGAIHSESCTNALKDIDLKYDGLLRDSVDAIVASAVIFGWFK